MNICTRILAISVLMIFSGCQSIAGDPVLRLTLKTVDDEGEPVEGAKASFGGERRPKSPDESSKGTAIEGFTDAHGIFTGELEVWNARQSGYSVEKPGYYPVTQHSYSAKAPVRGKWQPWNPTVKVVLKRIRNPVPMYAKRVGADIPVSGAEVGFDLVEGDWVAPHGRGRVRDIIFHGSGEVMDDRNYRGELTVSFPGHGNGLISHEIPLAGNSPLRMPYEAPADGYEPRFIWRSVRKYNAQKMESEEYIDDSSKTKNFFLRVRSEVDDEGKVVKAMYGKIHAPFIFDARGIDPWGKTKRQYVSFTYYLNPEGTRNIEFDPTSNLLKPTKRDDPAFRSLEP